MFVVKKRYEEYRVAKLVPSVKTTYLYGWSCIELCSNSILAQILSELMDYFNPVKGSSLVQRYVYGDKVTLNNVS